MRGRLLTTCTAIAAVACVLAGGVSGGVRDSTFVERATQRYHATVGCYDRSDWAGLVDSGYPDLKGHETEVYGLWRYEIRQVALPVRGCRALERWRQTPAARVSIWIFVLGHELTHTQQTDLYNAPWSRPFDEVQADCGGFAKFQSLKRALRIKRPLKPPPRSFGRCPLKHAVARKR
ncbi:MAG TPA: hypothetical protein VLU96_10470 [Gaiellaceae bacterium]|nr:hypothetical protein [Gaiellaceae bacterium]